MIPFINSSSFINFWQYKKEEKKKKKNAFIKVIKNIT
jgi:hypothetical protein